MKKFAKIDVSDNWADEMDIEYMTFMPMTEWKKLEAKLMKCDAPVEIGIGTNESVWYENGEDYLGHCAVTEVDYDGEGHGNDSLDPMNVYEWLLDAKKCAKARGVENAKAEAFLKRLYRDIVKDYDANRQTRYVVHMTCSNSPRGYFSGVMSKNFNTNDKPFTFKTEVKEVHFIEKDGAMQTLDDRVRIPDDAMDEGIRGCVDSWRKQHYGDWNLKEFYSQTMTDNMFMRKIDGVEELATGFMGNPRTIVNNGNATLGWFKCHVLELVEKDYYQMFETRGEADSVVKMVESNMQEILDAGYVQALDELDKFVNDKKKQLKALYAQEV